MGMFVRMLMQVSTGEFTRKFVREFVREGMGGKMGIKKPVVLITLFMGLFINTLFVTQVSAGILSGHFASPRLIQFSILNLTIVL
jgi:hypothetical protein